MSFKHRQKMKKLLMYFCNWKSNLYDNHTGRICLIYSKANCSILCRRASFITCKTQDHIISRSMFTSSSLNKIKHKRKKINDVNLLLQIELGNEFQKSLLVEFVSSRNETTFKDWDRLLENILKLDHGFGILNSLNIDEKIIEMCDLYKQLTIAKSYLEYLNHYKKKLSPLTICKFIKLCYNCKELCTEQDKAKIKQFIDYLLSIYDELDHISRYSILKGLLVTNQWERCLEVANKIQQSNKLSVLSHSIVLTCFLNNNAIQQAWEYMTRMAGKKLFPFPYVLIQWISVSKNNPQELEKILFFFEKYDYNPVKTICDQIVRVFSEFSINKLNGIYTTISDCGKCYNCSKLIKQISISNDEFQSLRTAFFNNALIEESIFCIGSSERELFYSYIENNGSFDVILNGLNLAYIRGKNQPENLYVEVLGHIIKYFLKQKKRILLLGRKYMETWPNIYDLEKDINLYFIDNGSRTNPFLLYAALHSGPDTIFVTRDTVKMDDLRLQDEKLTHLLKKWQSTHHVIVKYLESFDHIDIKMPITFKTTVQKTDKGGWHIPYRNDDYEDEKTLNISQKWLCLHPEQL